jgi:hypothetical protein
MLFNYHILAQRRNDAKAQLKFNIAQIADPAIFYVQRETQRRN